MLKDLASADPPGENISGLHGSNMTASLPRNLVGHTGVYAIDNRTNYQQSLGRASNSNVNFEGEDFQTYHIVDSGDCHVLKEVVYLSAIPQVPLNDFNKGAWLADLESEEINDIANTSIAFLPRHAPVVPSIAPEADFVLKCPDCKESVACECQLYLHKLLQHEALESVKDLKCQICGKNCSRISAFRSHLSLHLLRSDQVCPRCRAQITDDTTIHDTEESVIPISSNQYRCRLCGVNHSSLTQLRIHYKKNHPKRRENHCEVPPPSHACQSPESPPSQSHGRNCKVKASKFIKEIAAASKHKKRRVSPAPNPVPSSHVGQMDYLEHVKKIFVSKKKRILQCNICQRKLSSVTLAKTHVLMHFGVKPFSCPICSKTFTQKGSVETHMAIHNAAKGLSCSFCQRKFTFKQNLDVHISRYHSKLAKMVTTARKNQELRSFIVTYKSLSQPVLASFCLFLCMFTGYTGRRYPCRFCLLTFSSFSVHCFHELVHLHGRKHSKFYAMKVERKLVQRRISRSSMKLQGDLNVVHTSDNGTNRVLTTSRRSIYRCSLCQWKSDTKAALSYHHRSHRCVRKRHLDKLNTFGSLLDTSHFCSHCPWCSKRFTSVRSAKMHFVTHFLADAFVCKKCDRRFTSSILCRRHIKQKHGLKKLQLRVILRCDLPLSLQCRIGLRSPLPIEPSSGAIEASNVPVEVVQLPDAPQIPPVTSTEQLGQEILWLPESESHIPDVTHPSVIVVPPESDRGQLTDAHILPVDHSFVLGQGFQSGDMLLLPQASTLDNLDSYSQDVFYGENTYVDASTFEADYQPAVDFVQDGNSALDFNTEVTIATEPPLLPSLPPPPQGALVQQTDPLAFFGCCQCTARFDNGEALSNHIISHATPTRYNVCLSCGMSRLDAGDTSSCCTCGHNAFYQMEALLEDAVIGCARFYCTHCNLVFSELDQLEAHVAELTTATLYQHQPVVEEVVTVEPVQPVVRSRRPAQPKKMHFELSAEELQKIVQNQPTPESSLSERLLYEAACERDSRSYPVRSRTTAEDSSASSKERPHVCAVCSFRFQRNSDLHRHMFLHTGVRPYGCKFCNRRFILPRRLLAHATRLHGSEGLAWATAFLSGRPRSRRFLSTPAVVGSLTCHLCGATCSSAGSLHSHMRIHTGTKTYACPHCNLSFRTPIQRKRHLRTCQKRSVEEPTDLDAVPNDPVSFDLTPYLLDFQQSSGFKDLLTTDTSALPLPPPQTSTSSQKYVKLDNEVGTSSSYISLWQCKHCSESFTTNKAFAKHHCSAQMPHSRTLQQLDSGRTVEVPNGLRRGPHPCSTCHKQFSRPTDLRRHERIHSNARPFVCEVCNARFSQSGSLAIHRRTHEETQRRFKCRLCGAAFFVRSNMLRHVARIHGQAGRRGGAVAPS